jgi:hypothetical protein
MVSEIDFTQSRLNIHELENDYRTKVTDYRPHTDKHAVINV